MNLKQSYLSEKSIFKKSDPQKSHRTLEVKARHFNRLKVGVGASLLTIITMTAAIVYLNKQNAAKVAEKQALEAKIENLQKELGEESSTLALVSTKQQGNEAKALTYIESIEQKLGKINNYLRKRGLNGFSFTKHTRPKSDGKPASEQLYASYDNYLDRFANTVALMPMGYPRVSAFTSFFGYRGNPFDFGGNEFHPGIDFRGQVGDPVKCTASGTVVYASRAGGYGNCVRIKHLNNIETVYGHLSHIGVRVGQKVSVGDVIGKVGSTGRSTGPHLHYEVRRNGKPVNPKVYLSLNT